MGYNILVLNWRDIKNPYAGGAEVQLQHIFKRLASMGHRVTLLSSHFKGGLREETIDGIEVIRRGDRWTFNYTVPWMYLRHLKKRRFDIVVDDMNKVPFYTPLYIKEPLVAMTQHMHGTVAFREAPLPCALYVYLAERAIALAYKKVPFLTISESTRDELVGMGIPEKNIEIVHCGVDSALYFPGSDFRSTTPLVLCVSRFRRYKGVHLAIEAMDRVRRAIPEAQLMLIGTGEQEENLRKLVRRQNLEAHVQFAGPLSPEAKVAMLRRAWLLLNPSSKEGWGLTVLEANACGVPVVTFDSPGLKEAVRDGETGFLVRQRDGEAMAEKVITLIQDVELRERMAQGALQWARGFSWDEAARKTLAFLEKAIEAQKGLRGACAYG